MSVRKPKVGFIICYVGEIEKLKLTGAEGMCIGVKKFLLKEDMARVHIALKTQRRFVHAIFFYNNNKKKSCLLLFLFSTFLSTEETNLNKYFFNFIYIIIYNIKWCVFYLPF
jgi:hypothetical protein